MATDGPGDGRGAPADDDGRLEVSVVIPAFNEARRIAEPLGRVGAYLRRHHPASEIVLADDGSTDGTADIVRAIAAELGIAVRVLASPRNRGKGNAIRRG